MYVENGRFVLSPSDLVGFLHCPHLTELTLATTHGYLPKSTNEDPDLEVVQRRGLEHERLYLQRLEVEGHEVAQIDTETTFDFQVEATLERIHSGPQVIYQAAFLNAVGDGPAWRGHADFLQRVERSSQLGDFSYEPEDTKGTAQSLVVWVTCPPVWLPK